LTRDRAGFPRNLQSPSPLAGVFRWSLPNIRCICVRVRSHQARTIADHSPRPFAAHVRSRQCIRRSSRRRLHVPKVWRTSKQCGVVLLPRAGGMRSRPEVGCAFWQRAGCERGVAGAKKQNGCKCVLPLAIRAPIVDLFTACFTAPPRLGPGNGAARVSYRLAAAKLEARLQARVD
jgi:hypothetical protein